MDSYYLKIKKQLKYDSYFLDEQLEPKEIYIKYISDASEFEKIKELVDDYLPICGQDVSDRCYKCYTCSTDYYHCYCLSCFDITKH